MKNLWCSSRLHDPVSADTLSVGRSAVHPCNPAHPILGKTCLVTGGSDLVGDIIFILFPDLDGVFDIHLYLLGRRVSYRMLLGDAATRLNGQHLLQNTFTPIIRAG
jgi:hypothetical protein